LNDTSEQSSAAERLNYFNYFTEVEEEFVRRRGKPLLVSPLDWALIESWKNAGIPLHVVLRAINKSFDGYEARARKYRKVNSIFYCQQEVEASFAEYRLAQVGSSATTDTKPPGSAAPSSTSQSSALEDAFPKHVLLEFLTRSNEELRAALEAAQTGGHNEATSAIERARIRLSEIQREVEENERVNAETIEHDLDAIDRMLLASTRRDLGDDGLAKLRQEAENQLKTYRKKMNKAIYEQTLDNFVARRLRETNRLPRLSLFYI
jgi:hypothetical protein